MTDWLPWGAALMAGTFATLAVLVRDLGRTPAGQPPDLRATRRTLLAAVLVSLLVYGLYLAAGERWIWY